MALYFLLLDAARLERQIRPALASNWRLRSFAPCQALCAALLPEAQSFAERYRTGAEEPLLAQVVRGLPFDRAFWRALAGECLWYGAAAIPELETAPETLSALLGGVPSEGPRDSWPSIQQVHWGARDLVFGGGFYRPEQAGYNNPADVARLRDYLAAVDPARWNTEDLRSVPSLADEDDRREELDFVREWFPALRDLYRGAAAQGQVVVCEVL